MAIFPQTNIINNKGAIEVNETIVCESNSVKIFTVNIGNLIPKGIATNHKYEDGGYFYGVSFFGTDGNPEHTYSYAYRSNGDEKKTNGVFTRYDNKGDCYINVSYSNGKLIVEVYSYNISYPKTENISFYIF